MPNKTIAGYFQQDHDKLDGFFTEYRKKKNIDFARAKESFKAFMFGLKRHIAWEENILFPVFEKKTGNVDSGLTGVMRSEHKDIKEILNRIHEKVRDKNTKTEAEETALLEVLGSHNQKEEHILYPMIDQLTSDTERENIFAQMEKVPEQNTESCCGMTFSE